jgi:hypothetical protein
MGIIRKRQLFCAWHENGIIRLSQFPADMPYRPSIGFDTKRQLELYADKKRADIYCERQPFTASAIPMTC